MRIFGEIDEQTGRPVNSYSVWETSLPSKETHQWYPVSITDISREIPHTYLSFTYVVQSRNGGEE